MFSKKDYDKLEKSISDDYQAYLDSLSPEERMWASPTWFLEDGTGQHAVTFEVAWYGTAWTHVLIYDKNNKRIKATKYISGHYRS